MITHIGDTPIDNQGMIKLDKDLRVHFAYKVQHVAKNGVLPLTVVRSGKVVKIELPVSTERPTLVGDLHGNYPSYFIYGPMVFSTATWQFISGFGEQPRHRARSRVREEPVDHARARSARRGAPGARGGVLAVLSEQTGERLLEPGRLGGEFRQRYAHQESRAPGGACCATSRIRSSPSSSTKKAARGWCSRELRWLAATDDILTDNGVRAQGSPDMLAIWQGKAPN